jgi:hypothetical protein
VRERGCTLLETTLVLGLLALLACAGMASVRTGPLGLAFLPGELRGALDQAMLRARAQGRDVRLSLDRAGGDVPPVVLPRGVRWGTPPDMHPPRPPGMEPTVKAHLAGFSHPFVTLTPRGTAKAACWFLTDGRNGASTVLMSPRPWP